MDLATAKKHESKWINELQLVEWLLDTDSKGKSVSADFFNKCWFLHVYSLDKEKTVWVLIANLFLCDKFAGGEFYIKLHKGLKLCIITSTVSWSDRWGGFTFTNLSHWTGTSDHACGAF